MILLNFAKNKFNILAVDFNMNGFIWILEFEIHGQPFSGSGACVGSSYQYWTMVYEIFREILTSTENKYLN